MKNVLLFAFMTVLASPAITARPNVLFIAIDDLNDWIGALGGHPQARTPNLDRLAGNAVLFTRAYCAAPACNPSRAALMTGILPSTSGVYHNPQPWRKAMPDAVTAMVQLMQAPAESLSRVVYNINAFNPSAGEFAERTREVFPDAQISFEPDLQRERLVHSWPASVNDTLARSEWGFSPTYDIRRTFDEYLVPNIKKRYS